MAALDGVFARAYGSVQYAPIDHLAELDHLVVALARAGGGFGRIIPKDF